MVTGKLKVVFTYLAYPVAMARYMLEALYRRDDLEVLTAGPFSSTWIPWKSGIFLPAKYTRKPDFPLANGAPMNYAWLKRQLPWEPDVWVEGNAGLVTQDRPPGLYAVIGTDPHVIDYSKQRREADFFFCMQKPYMQPRDYWMPYAYDPVWHTPTAIPWADRSYDVSLIGLMYQHRTELMSSLSEAGKHIFYDTGPCYDEAREIYHKTRVGVNWSSRQDTTARVFELMAFGIPAVLNRVPDLAELFVEGEHYAGFATKEEAIITINSLLANPKEANEMAQKALSAVKPHTWDARMEQMLNVIRSAL